MDSEEDDIEKAERYLQGDMDETEKAEVKSRLAGDADFRMLMEDLRALRQGTRMCAREDIKSKFQEIETKATSGEINGRRVWLWSMGIAASVFLVVAAYLWWPAVFEDKDLALFGEVFEPYPNIIMPIERGVDLDSTGIIKAFRAYEAGDFDTAILVLEGETKKDAGVYFYLGVSYLAKGEAQKARLNFEKASEGESHVLEEQIQWYIALSYLRENERASTLLMLESIVKRGGDYAARANNLLIKLKAVK